MFPDDLDQKIHRCFFVVIIYMYQWVDINTDPLGKKKKIPWTKGADRLQSMGLQAGHDLATNTFRKRRNAI